MSIYKISQFFRQFFSGSDDGSGGKFWHVKSTYSDRKILCFKVSYGILVRLFFLN